MSMMMNPQEAGLPPGLPGADAGGGLPPMDPTHQMPLPGEGGMDGLLAALAGGMGGGGASDPLSGLGGGPTEGLGGEAPPEEEEGFEEMDSIRHIQEAMKHLMMAMAKDEDEERGSGIVKGMGALQGILGGHQKQNKQLESLIQ